MPSTIHLLGAGPVGCLAAILLRQRGFETVIYERRSDSRKAGAYGGRSINLALSDRGFTALAAAGLADEIRQVGLPMPGRLVHDLQGGVQFQPYGQDGQAIYSVSRSGLNYKLMDLAEQNGVQIHFDTRCVDVDHQARTLILEKGPSKETLSFEVLLGTDGAFSALRYALQKTDRFEYSQSYLPHGYKELHIPPTASGDFAMDPNGLHIWPRGQFMMIALPNPDRSFTCTLFYPFEADPGRGVALGLNEIQNDELVLQVWNQYFGDTLPLMPTLLHDFHNNPNASLITVRCSPWNLGNTCLLGDAAHAIVPFYGQGLNAGLEDVRMLIAQVDENAITPQSSAEAWAETLQHFGSKRKPDGDAVAQLALDNFVEMRDKVADPRFVFQKKLEARLHQAYPDRWVPLYSQVTFQPQTPYHIAYQNGQEQQKFMNHVLDLIPPDKTNDEAWIDALLHQEIQHFV